MEKRIESGMILIINICKEKLHYLEFVKPVCDILNNHGIRYFVKRYKEVNEKDLDKASKIIICGTSLQDNEFVKDVNKFEWLLEFNKPVLGICGGMQVIGLVFNGKLKKRREIGYYLENFNLEFLGLKGEQGVYHLHNYYVDFFKMKEFRVYCGDKVSQAVKHKEKEIYGVLFHPEVRQKGLIKNFCLL